MGFHQLAAWRRCRLSALTATGAIVLALGLVACGGTSEGDNTPTATATATVVAVTSTPTELAVATSTPTPLPTASVTRTVAAPTGTAVGTPRGQTIAHSAMLELTDLPGTGWTVASVDRFVDNPAAALGGIELTAASTPACKAAGVLTLPTATALPTTIGHANKTFIRIAGLQPSTIAIDVAVYDDIAAVAARQAASQRSTESPEAQECLNDVFKSLSGLGGSSAMSVQVARSTPSMPAPHGGSALAYEMTIGNASLELHSRIEVYTWINGAGAVTAVITTSPDKAAELVTAVTGTVDALLADAQR